MFDRDPGHARQTVQVRSEILHEPRVEPRLPGLQEFPELPDVVQELGGACVYQWERIDQVAANGQGLKLRRDQGKSLVQIGGIKLPVEAKVRHCGVVGNVRHVPVADVRPIDGYHRVGRLDGNDEIVIGTERKRQFRRPAKVARHEINALLGQKTKLAALRGR